MVMRMTSLMAFDEIQKNGTLGFQEQLIYNYIKNNPKLTRRQIAKDLDLDTSTVSARVNGLLNKNLITDEKKGKCPISSKEVGLLEVLNESN